MPPGRISLTGFSRVVQYAMLGTAATVEFDSAEVAEAIDGLLRPFHRPCPSDAEDYRYWLSADEGEWLLTVDGVRLAGGPSWPQVAACLLADLNRRVVTGFSGLAVHAGVVARGTEAVAFPAPSGGGKSTLTAACVAGGFEYVSDEALCLDFATGAVVPYPRPLQLPRPSLALAGITAAGLGLGGEELALTAGDLGGRVAQGDLRLTHLVQLRRRPGTPVLFPLNRAEAVAALLAMSFNHYRHPRAAFDLAIRLARSTQTWRLDYDDPRAAAGLLLATFIAVEVTGK